MPMECSGGSTTNRGQDSDAQCQLTPQVAYCLSVWAMSARWQDKLRIFRARRLFEAMLMHFYYWWCEGAACIRLVGMQEYIVDTLCGPLLSKLLYGVSIALRAPRCDGTNAMHALIIVHNCMSSSSVTWWSHTTRRCSPNTIATLTWWLSAQSKQSSTFTYSKGAVEQQYSCVTKHAQQAATACNECAATCRLSWQNPTSHWVIKSSCNTLLCIA